jgi:hypothetical protein
VHLTPKFYAELAGKGVEYSKAHSNPFTEDCRFCEREAEKTLNSLSKTVHALKAY